jgi:hypothetical protein
MKRHDTDHPQAELLRVLDNFARGRNLSIADESTQTELLDELSKALKENRSNPIRLHGFRVQSMFAYVAAALGHSTIISEEDSGIFFDGVGGLRQPDFRIVVLDGTKFLVEVKNFHEKNSHKPYIFKKPYLDAICLYAEEMGIPLKFAIYWSRWSIWTLVDSSRLDRSSLRTELPLTVAVKLNEMNILGDSMVGTKPPLALRLHADPTKPRLVSKSGEAPFTIGRVSLHSGDAEVTDEAEKKLTWFLMLNGKWTDVRQTAKVDGDLLEFMEISAAPEETTEGQGFEIVGTMSQMISNQYLRATSKEGVIRSLAPQVNANELGVIIPRDYEGEALHLWRLHVAPNFEDIDETNAS